MSNRLILKTSERNQIDQAMQDFLAKGGKVKRFERLTAEQLEEQWTMSLPATMRARLERIKMRKEET